jgi:hypothetical protein
MDISCCNKVTASWYNLLLSVIDVGIIPMNVQVAKLVTFYVTAGMYKQYKYLTE